MAKSKFGRAVLAAALGIFFGGGIFQQGSAREVIAAQTPSVSEMRVVASENGVSARCEFSGYTDNKYSIQLYLYQMDGEKPAVVNYEELTPTGDGAGIGNTPWKHVDTGLYKASAAIKRYEGADLAETVFADSDLYDVVRNGNSYIVTPFRKPDTENGKAESISQGRGSNSKKSSGEEKEDRVTRVCEHDIVSDIVREAETTQDALLAERCRKCGEVFSCVSVPNSAYRVFLREAAGTIQNAEKEEAVIVTDRWMSFNREVADAMAARPEVTVTVRYRYDGQFRSVTVPAGTDMESLLDEDGFCGFLYLGQLFAE